MRRVVWLNDRLFQSWLPSNFQELDCTFSFVCFIWEFSASVIKCWCNKWQRNMRIGSNGYFLSCTWTEVPFKWPCKTKTSLWNAEPLDCYLVRLCIYIIYLFEKVSDLNLGRRCYIITSVQVMYCYFVSFAILNAEESYMFCVLMALSCVVIFVSIECWLDYFCPFESFNIYRRNVYCIILTMPAPCLEAYD